MFLFNYDLFGDAVIISVYKVSNDRMISEQWTGKHKRKGV
jgi:hypothetical protein